MESCEPRRIAHADRSPRRSVDHPLQGGERKVARDGRIAWLVVLATRGHRDDPPGRRAAEGKEHGEAASGGKGVDRAGFKGSICFHISENEILWVASALEGKSGALSHSAMGAIAADKIRRSDPLFAGARVPERAVNVRLGGLEPGQLDAALDRHSR